MDACKTSFNPNYSENNPSLEEINELSGYAFLEFGAPWCGHCVTASSAIEEALTPLQLPHIKAYDGKGLPLGRSFKVRLWPTLILLKDGAEIARVVRPTSIADVSELLASIES